MELKYVVLTIIKILISVPGIFLYRVSGAVEPDLIKLPLNRSQNVNNKEVYTLITTEELQRNPIKNDTIHKVAKNNSEDVPDPLPLIVPGYNLPDTIFNKGKPFYLEKDPVTGNIDFNSKISPNMEDEFYDEPPQSDDLYAKSNIDRKDGSIGGHRPSDVNQLTPNFHDFLNLPVKYNPDKYLYPMISSSYANTNIQGNVHRIHNHKDFVKTTSSKPAISPTYYSPTEDYYELPKSSTPKSTTSTTTASTTQVYLTSDAPNLMGSDMYQPSLEEDFEYYDDNENKWASTSTTTTQKPSTSTTTVSIPTTKKPLSLFEQLFGDYEAQPEEAERPKPTLPSTTSTTPPPKQYHNSHSGPTQEQQNYEEEYANEFEEVPPTTPKTTSTSSSTTTSTTARTTTTSTTTQRPTTIVTAASEKVTSLPLGDNHVTNLHNQPIIVATQNLRDKLNSEKVKNAPLGKPHSTSNIHIAPDQDTVSFVVGHHQSFDNGASYSIVDNETPYDSNPFRPLYGTQNVVSYDIGPKQEHNFSVVQIQPIENSESSVAIGTPLNLPVAGQVISEPIELHQEIKGTGNKIVFPDEKQSTVNYLAPVQNIADKDVLQLNSQPMYHQLPSDLTPPKEKEVPAGPVRSRPPWDPRPGHFHSGKPEYVRPPRPPPQNAQVPHKRIDHLPNILPQFRPNMKTNTGPHYLNRQPLLDRPYNRPVGFFEKLQPPPPPKNLHALRKIPPPSDVISAEERIVNEPPKNQNLDQFKQFQKPPEVIIANRRIGNLNGDVETLQMIQAKQSDKNKDSGTEKPLYVVYPVNTPPIRLDATDSNVKESVVIGTRAELPLPPSKIRENFDYEQNPIFNPKDRHDAPILKPHLRPSTFPIKSDFPYPLERPDPSVRYPEVYPNSNNNMLDEGDFISNNQWNTVHDSYDNGPKSNPNQISVTLRTRTDKPIAVAYTPTEPQDIYERVKPGIVDDGKRNSEFTVSAVMHTHPQHERPNYGSEDANRPVQDFQAPFHASDNVDSLSQGWSVVRENNNNNNNNNNNKPTTEESEETTNLPLATTKEFDIENFKPKLIGGFKPIYHFQDEVDTKSKDTETSER